MVWKKNIDNVEFEASIVRYRCINCDSDLNMNAAANGNKLSSVTVKIPYSLDGRELELFIEKSLREFEESVLHEYMRQDDPIDVGFMSAGYTQDNGNDK